MLFQLTLAEDLDDGSCLLQTRSLQTSLSTTEPVDCSDPSTTFASMDKDGIITLPSDFDADLVHKLCEPYGSEDVNCKNELMRFETFDDPESRDFSESPMCSQYQEFKFYSLKNYATFARVVLLDYMVRFSFLDLEKLTEDEDLKNVSPGDLSATIIDSFDNEQSKVNAQIETLVAPRIGLPWTTISSTGQVVLNTDPDVPSYETFIDVGTTLRALGSEQVFKSKIKSDLDDPKVKVQNLMKYTGQRMRRLGKSIRNLDNGLSPFCDYEVAFKENRCNVQHNFRNVCLHGGEGEYMCLCEFSAGQDCMYDIANEQAYFHYYEQKAYDPMPDWTYGAENVWKTLKCGTDDANAACSWMQYDGISIRNLLSFW